MRVEPELVDHPKYLRLKRRLGKDCMEILLRLWGHCQNSQRGGTWINADREYVEVIAHWPGKPGKCYRALRELHWLDERSGAVVIHDWDAFNSKAKASWMNGKLGGRPKHTEANEGGKPNSNPWVNSNANTVNPSEPMAIQRVSESVSQSVSSTGGNKKGVEIAQGLAASRTQWAALTKRQKELEALRQAGELEPEDRAERQKNAADLADLEAKQRAGVFK